MISSHRATHRGHTWIVLPDALHGCAPQLGQWCSFAMSRRSVEVRASYRLRATPRRSTGTEAEFRHQIYRACAPIVAARNAGILAQGEAWWRRAIAIATVGGFLSILAAPTVSAAPVSGDWFEYDFNTFLDGGTGDYEGYTETMLSHSRYEIAAVSSDLVSVQGDGTWSYSASDGTTDSGTFSTSFSFSSVTRRYVSGIDVEGNYVDPAVWFWVSPEVTAGELVRILDEEFTVTSVDETVDILGGSRFAIRLEATGAYTRDDVYGRFNVTYVDVYYFDRATGYLLLEVYDERDVSPTATFGWSARATVTASSFALIDGAGAPFDWTPVVLLIAGVLAALAAGAFLVWRLTRGPGRFTVPTTQGPLEVRIRRIRKPQALNGLAPDASPAFGPLLMSFARRALATRDPVVLAVSGPRIVGLLTYDGESGLGSLFATEGPIALALLKRLPVQDFFVESAGSAWRLPAEPVDSFKILERRDLTPPSYDPAIVRPMLAEDLPAVVGIAEAVYRGRASRWVDTSFREGDIAYVAAVDGRVVGFGFATASGYVGRLHTLTVLAAYRDRGLGTELTAARLSALVALGVQRVVVEISQHNAASLRVAGRAGFKPIAETVYYSRVPRSSAMAFQRQF